MKIIISDTKNSEEIINYLVANGFNQIILLGRNKINAAYYKLNGIEITEVASFITESTKDKLEKIRGSITESFLFVYSREIVDFCLEEIIKDHKQMSRAITLIVKDEKMCAFLAECEIMEYLENETSLEKDVISRLGEENELWLYN